MPGRLLDDDAVRALSPVAAVDTMREAVRLAYAGQLSAPPRVRAELSEHAYVFTVGGVAGGPTGFRAYRAGGIPSDQLVAVWGDDGALEVVVAGGELGPRRTGALGAVAADVLAREDAHDVAIIGSGVQAWTQIWALTAVREIRAVRVFSPTPERRDAFAGRVRRELGLPATAVISASEALAAADVIMLATTATQPVIDAGEVSPGAHVITVGPKTIDGHETPVDLADRATVITCDSPAQAEAYGTPFFTGIRPLVDLGAVLSGAHPGRTGPADITLHCSVGLAGTEVMLAQRVLQEATQSPDHP